MKLCERHFIALTDEIKAHGMWDRVNKSPLDAAEYFIFQKEHRALGKIDPLIECNEALCDPASVHVALGVKVACPVCLGEMLGKMNMIELSVAAAKKYIEDREA